VCPVLPVVPKEGFLLAVTADVLAYVAVFCAELLRAKILDIVYNKEIKKVMQNNYFS
jgi:hypothetical protein